MRLAPPGKYSSSGFSLVELMVVLVLLAIFSAVMVPAMRGTFEDALLKATARKLVSACHVAYSTAVTRNQPYVLRIATAEGRYLIEAKTRPTEEKTKEIPGGTGDFDSRIKVEVADAQEAVSESAELAPVIDTSGGKKTVHSIDFYPDGTSEAKKVVLRDRDGIVIVLAINPITSRVTISGEEERP